MTRFLVVGLIMASALASSAHARDLKRVGWVEKIAIADVGTVVKAKLDTGATTSSLDAEIIDIRKAEDQAEGDSGDTVIFSVALDDGTQKTFERPVRRYVKIKQKEGGYIRRPVIEMNFCIAGRPIKEEVNLANREGFIYPVLVGRNMMQHADLVIDASETFTSKPNCDD